MRGNQGGGFSLIEAVIATAIMVTALAGLGPLLAAASRANTTARVTTVMVMAARQKMEELRALPDAHASLAPSPAGSLHANLPGYHDLLDASGRAASVSVQAPLVRRWSISPLGQPAGGSLVLQVQVAPRSSIPRPGGGTSVIGVWRPAFP